MKGHTVPFIESVRETLVDPEARRVYLQAAILDLLTADPLDCAITLHLFFDAYGGYEKAGAEIGLTGEALELALRNSTTLTLQQFGQLIQFAIRNDKFAVVPDLLTATSIPAAALERQAA